jgi:spore coat polysaccharide biosynthesis predicted glycosyltransferase SpsG
VTESLGPSDGRLTRVAFVTEGGSAVGLGHVARCAALARAVAGSGARVSFVVPDDPRVLALLRRDWADVVPVPWTTDPTALLDALRRRDAEVVVVDSYAAGPELLRALRTVAGQVVAVDDEADRELPVDVVVNGGVSAERLPYRRTPDTVYLLGPSYALLDSSFAESPARSWGTRVQRILVCLGGGRHGATLLEVLAGLDQVASDWTVEVAAGSFSHDWPELDAAARRARYRVSLHRDRFGLRDLMLAADIAVSGGGVTLCELAATATPTVALQTADNQAGNVDGFERAGAALVVRAGGTASLGDRVATALTRLAGDHALRASMGARARGLVDGRGALRVATVLARLPVSRR